MREIKYRVWDLDEKKLYNHYFGVNIDNSIVHLYGDSLDYVKENFRDKIRLLQYTGIKDVNHIEIYEGDIVECFREGLSIIEFAAGSFILDGPIHSETLYDCCGEIKIIGNIFENPELINSKK